MSDPPKQGSSLLDTPGRLVAALTAAIAVLATLGAVTGGLERMFRNSRLESLIALLLILASSLLIVWATIAPPPSKESATGLLLATSFLFVLGLGLGIYLAVSVPSMRESPLITGALTTDPRLTLTAHVRAAGVHSDESLVIIVDGVASSPTNHGTDWAHTRLMTQTVGPDSTGVVDVPVTVEIPPGPFDDVVVAAGDFGGDRQGPICDPESIVSGCIVLSTPGSVAPQLEASWGTTQATPVLELKVVSQGVSQQDRVFLRVTASGGSGRGSDVLLTARFAADNSGVMDKTLSLPIAGRYRNVCVASQTADTADPPKPPCLDRVGVEWIRLRVPTGVG
jgi:hypothetical protein